MSALGRILALIVGSRPWVMLRGTVLAVVVPVMGVGLLGLSGWFVTAAAVAGAAGTTIDFFLPSAGVRFFALGRAASRYGERLLTHDATLQALAALRVALLRGVARQPFDRLARMRSGVVLNRMTADIDAVDGVALRLVLPLVAAASTCLLVFVALWLLVSWGVAIWVLTIFVLGVALAIAAAARSALLPARRAERATQALRSGTIDLLRARSELAVAGVLERHTMAVLAADKRSRLALAAVDRIERRSDFILSATATVAAAGALALGADLVQSAGISVAIAAIGFFVARALAETLSLLTRGITEIGRMTSAARRISRTFDAPEASPFRSGAEAGPDTGQSPGSDEAPAISAEGLAFRRTGAVRPVFSHVSLALRPGETVLLTGPSGIGKSTLLLVLAGLLGSSEGEVRLFGRRLGDWSESAFRGQLCLLPQRSALIGGTVRENLALAADTVLSDEEAWAALEAAGLAGTIRRRGGLDMLLGEAGSGLSGGESRRLCLARALLRRPAVLLLDEPTEGLDPETASVALRGIRALLPLTAILTASHRDWDRLEADRVFDLLRN
jgi:ATP-binding cassette subfamily C protein CydC